MENHSAEEAKKKFEALPQEVKALLYSPQMSFVLQQVGTKNKLHLDQIDLLNTETGQFMLGFIEPKEFPDAIAEMLNINRAQADAIVQDINEMLLAPIREMMKKVTGAIESKSDEIHSAPAVNTPLAPEKSVVMPSAAKASEPVTPVPTPAPAAHTPPAAAAPTAPAMQTVPTPVKPAGLPMMPHVDTMLSQPTVSIAPKPAGTSAAAGPAPASVSDAPADVKKSDAPAPSPIYKTDPYHEPID